jgi:regulator of protease activity HflC (stomatin/prohibitin superfamily)
MFGFVSVPLGCVAILEKGDKVQTLYPGLNCYNPFTCSLKDLSHWNGRVVKHGRFIDMTEQVWSIDKISCLTKDQFNINSGLTLNFKIAENEGISEARRAVYAVNSLPDSLLEVCGKTLQSKVGLYTSEEFFANRQKINDSIMLDIASKVKRWGIRILGAELTSVEFEPKLSEALDQRRIAEALLANEKIEAEAKKVKADGDAYTLTADAKAQAEAQAAQRAIVNDAEIKYIRDLAECLGPERASRVVQVEKNANALSQVSQSPNTKMIIPTDSKGMFNVLQEKA